MKHYVPERTYETTVILRPTLNDSDVEQHVNAIRSAIETHAKRLVKVDVWGRRKLAYPIQRFQEGIYAFFVFEAEPSFIEELTRQYRINEDILRYLTIRCEGTPDEIAANLAEMGDSSDRGRMRRDGSRGRRERGDEGRPIRARQRPRTEEDKGDDDSGSEE